MALDPLVQQFIDQYKRQKSEPGPEPAMSPQAILEVEDMLSDVLCLIDVLSLSEEEREDLRGQRVAEMTDLIAETADGLRAFRDLALGVGVTPESLETASAQDQTLAAVAQSLQVTVRRTDSGLLQASERADQLLQTADARFEAALSRAPSSGRGEALEARVSAVAGRRRRLEAAAPPPPPPSPEEQRLGDALDQQALDEAIRDFVSAALRDRDKDKGRPRKNLAEEIHTKGIAGGLKPKKNKE
jgi:hypothetical protein